jgi:hypothetical protein
MVTVLLDHPWVPLCLLYVGGWVITFVCAGQRRPTTGGGSPAEPTATEEARAEAAE